MTDSIRNHLLLVEDEAILAMTEKMQLEKYGYAVRTVTTGEKAIEAVHNSSDIDLILMDIDLGKGMDGTQAAKEILRHKDIPVVFLSSHTEPEIVEKTEQITSYGYVVKSSSITVLDASIKMAFKLFDASSRLTHELAERNKVEEKYHSLFDQSMEGIYLHDLDGRILDVNTMACAQSGYSREELLDLTVFDIHPYEDIHPCEDKTNLPKAEILQAWRQWKTGERQLVEAQHQRKDGTVYPIEISTGVVRYGNEKRIMAIVKDITDRKETETRLDESMQLLSRAQKIAHIGNWSLDLTTNRLWWSDEIYRIFGCKPQEFAATYEAFLDFVHPDDRAAVDSAYTRSVREGNNGYEIEHRIVRRDTGDVRYVHERCDHERDEAGTIVRSIGMVQDIAERKQFEQ